MLQSNINELHIIEAIDILPKNTPPPTTAKALNQNQHEIGGLASIFNHNKAGLLRVAFLGSI